MSRLLTLLRTIRPPSPRIIVDEFRHWIRTQGLWLSVSATFHAIVLTSIMLLMESLVVPVVPETNDAPKFESGFDTLVNGKEMEHFQLGGEPVDASMLSSEEVANNLAESTADAADTAQSNLAKLAADASAVSSDGGGGAGDGVSAVSSGGLANFDFRGAGRGGRVRGGGGGGSGGGSGGGTGSGSGSGVPRTSARQGVKSVAGVAGAAEGITGGLRRELADGDIFLVWLLDASISLVEDRQTLAEKLSPFYHELAGRDPRVDNRLNSAVVAYGGYPMEVEKSTKFTSRTLDAIRHMPIDPSGAENVMSAVQFCIERYARKAHGRLRIVIWTDESGDDNGRLEETIKLCRKIRTIVHVVGPSSVLGSDRGLQAWNDKASGYKFLLPVTRGPDSCLPERLMLPYWFDTSQGAGQFAGGMIADGIPWYGGALRERLLSGLGPYALTRLALETGGTFTLLDREADKSPFDFKAMRPYFPDYRSAEEVQKSITDRPFRLATWEAVMKTYKEVNLAAPKVRFYSYRQDRYPYRETGPGYRTPAEFRRLFLADLPQAVTHLSAAAMVIEDALARFKGREWVSEYHMETSRRWKAWYDLTHGRLLAMSIRHREYLAACKWLLEPGNMKPDTNYVTFEPSTKLRTKDQELEDRMTLGMKLLKRCEESNRGTPWEMLANWELENGFGVAPVQHVIPVPQPGGTPPPPEPKIVLPRL